MQTKVIVGLGNPGPSFQQTRHNAGFRVIELLAHPTEFQIKADLKAEVAERFLEGIKVVLVKPTTGMNTSGEAVAKILQHYNVPSSDLLMVYDDVSLPMGRLRLQRAGGAGGHHGIENTIRELQGDHQFDRLKIAVGPDPGGAKRFEFVLGAIEEPLLELYSKALESACDAARLWVKSGAQATMNRYNGLDLR